VKTNLTLVFSANQALLAEETHHQPFAGSGHGGHDGIVVSRS
jgi:transaldolase